MPTTFHKGDIFDASEGRPAPRGLAFGADCAGTMDAGIGNAFKKRWPALAEAYKAHCSSGKVQLGDVFTWKDGELVVYVLGLQKGGKSTKVSLFEETMKKLVARATADGVAAVLLPRVGATKGGMDWSRVKRVLLGAGIETKVDLVVFEQFVRKTAEQAT